MPMVKISLSSITKINTTEIMNEISCIVGEESGKGESSLMVSISESEFIMRGVESNCAFVDIRGIGKIEKKSNAAISIRISEVLIQKASIPAQNIYLNFSDILPENWGHSKGVY